MLEHGSFAKLADLGGNSFGIFFAFFSFGRRAQQLGTVTRIMVAGRARIVLAVAKCRTVLAFGLLCCIRVSRVSTITWIGGVVVAKLITVVAFGLAWYPRISAGLHMLFCNCFVLLFLRIFWWPL